MSAQSIDFDMVVDEVMRRWPATIRVFLTFRMACPGCPIAGFHTVADTCREHHADPAKFLAEIQRVAAGAGDGSGVGCSLGDSEQPVWIA